MSMPTFQLDRGGDDLADERRKTLETAKIEPRELFGRPPR